MEKKEEKKMQLDEQLMDNVNGGANYVSQQNRPTSSHTPCSHYYSIIIMEQKEQKKKVEEQKLDQVTGGIGIPESATSYPIVDKGGK